MNYRKFIDESLKLSKEQDIGLYEAEEKIRDKWIEQKKYQDFLQFLTDNYEWRFTEFSLPFLDALLSDNALKIYRNYWRGCLRERIKSFWYHYKFYNDNNHNKKPTGFLKYFKKQEKVANEKRITYEEFLAVDKKLVDENSQKYPYKQKSKLNLIGDWYKTLEFVDKFADAMKVINDQVEIEKAKALKESIYTLQEPKAKKTTDKRKIDETLFWELIRESQDQSQDSSEFLEMSQNRLENFSATEIKKFQKYFLEKMNELYSWEIWALAYIVQKGCGDDEFDYFRAWVISRGKDVYESVKTLNLKKLQAIFAQEDPQLEDMLYLAQNAYEHKKGEIMPDPRVKSQKLQGDAWTEETICKRYAELCRLFGLNIAK